MQQCTKLSMRNFSILSIQSLQSYEIHFATIASCTLHQIE